MVEYMIVTKCWWKKLLEEIKCKLISFHPETTSCHSERSEESLRSRYYEILRRPPSAGLLRMTSKNMVSGWKPDYDQEIHHAPPESCGRD